MLSLGGRHTLVNSVLSAVPLYTLSVYKIPNTLVKQIDQIRCRFLWQGTDRNKKKYVLLNWRVSCIAKEFGGWVRHFRVKTNEYSIAVQVVVEV